MPTPLLGLHIQMSLLREASSDARDRLDLFVTGSRVASASLLVALVTVQDVSSCWTVSPARAGLCWARSLLGAPRELRVVNSRGNRLSGGRFGENQVNPFPFPSQCLPPGPQSGQVLPREIHPRAFLLTRVQSVLHKLHLLRSDLPPLLSYPR